MHAACKLGMKVCVVDIREEAAVAAAAGIENALGSGTGTGSAVGLQADVTSDESMAALPAKVEAAFPGVPLVFLHANAGVIAGTNSSSVGPAGGGDTGVIGGHDMAGWDFAFSVNVMGVVRTLKTFLCAAALSKGICLVCPH
jgi:NAD(P)-dependent dehydrogenase (short-subunit alcohol dehydrogenase family)